ncbi:MAG TPA: MotA/TolQ/ExbB proton channel family protein [Pirellulales bacterium]|nr:MotA/TolQ/ExbB proton channel family protein [Pirellulales bacterium]
MAEKTAAVPATPLSYTSKKAPPGNLWEMIAAGGPVNIAFMGFLGFISLVAGAAAMERLAHLTRRRVAPADLVRDLADLVQKGESRAESFQEVCRRSPSPLAHIVTAGLLRAGRPLPEMEKAMEDAAVREMAELRARIRPLSVAANVAPLVGLLGTVVGMLEAFRVTSQVGTGKAEVLAEGIYLALETTVAGLVIAIPALLFASYFHSRGERLMREIDDHLTAALPAFQRLEQAGGAAKPAGGNPLTVNR